MSCYVDTIIKINQVRQSVKEESNLTHVWAIGVYPVESEDHEIEMVLFVPIDDHDRDPNTQSVFVKNEYFSVGGKMTVASSMHLTIRRDPGSNRCPLKVSLVGAIQDAAQEVDDENAIIKVSVKDYVGQNDSFIVKVVFLYRNNRFKHLTNSIRSDVSVLFVIGQMEVIQRDLYVYAIETSFVNAYFVDKNKGSSSNSQSTSGLYKSVRSRLLSAHQNVSGKFSKTSIKNNSKCAKINQTTIDLSTSVNRSTVFGSCSSKHIKIEDKDPEHVSSDYIEDECLVKDNKVYVDEGNKLVGCVINENVKKNCSEEGDGSGGMLLI
ncbi:1584_t:CDS:2 [Cetraspora pellucida]|uniref:1584_t:CDS:1 n=1 Tax=Cetraspora pellucida TaxID=1433469 RepID=A0A9N9I1J6_9GLOM|nr:1584_t:CDS:2 [Cetraspora pellucida]